MRLIAHPRSISQGQKLKSGRETLPEFRQTAFLPGVSSLDPSASIVPFLPDSLAFVEEMQERHMVKRLYLRSDRPTVGPELAPLVHNAKSHPSYLPPWLSVPTSPSWCYQVFSKDAFVCRHFPATPPALNAPSVRAAIYEFSDKSRRHLDHICCNSGHLVKSQFCLTYHEQQPEDGEEVKRHLDKWLKSYRRRFPGESYLWVLEFQVRGVPHFHIFLSVAVDREMQKKMALSWVRITKGSKKQLWWHCRHENWLTWKMDTGSYLLKQYAVKVAQKDVPQNFRNVGRFWGVSQNMQPVPTLFGPQEVANLTQKAVIPWEPAAIRHFFDKVLRRFQEKQMNYDPKTNQRRRDENGKVKRWKNSTIIRQESSLSGNFKVKNGARIIEKLLNYVVQYGPDRWSLQAAIKERVPF